LLERRIPTSLTAAQRNPPAEYSSFRDGLLMRRQNLAYRIVAVGKRIMHPAS
jgi:hypothetical protein